jgi:hypothetical protein
VRVGAFIFCLGGGRGRPRGAGEAVTGAAMEVGERIGAAEGRRKT